MGTFVSLVVGRLPDYTNCVTRRSSRATWDEQPSVTRLGPFERRLYVECRRTVTQQRSPCLDA
jgi:hypothetical protein